jgi:hypothetical protein
MGSILVEFTLESPVLESTLAACSDAHVVYVQESVSASERPQMAFWLVGDTGRFEAALDGDDSVREYDRLVTTADRTLYRVEISEEYRSKLTYDSFHDTGGVLLSNVADADGWHVRARFPDREALNAHRDRCLSMGVGFHLDSVYTSPGTESDQWESLTAAQREVLVAAVEMGYFEVPREATAEDVGERLGISRQAVSERLRRALGTIAERAIREEV